TDRDRRAGVSDSHPRVRLASDSLNPKLGANERLHTVAAGDLEPQRSALALDLDREGEAWTAQAFERDEVGEALQRARFHSESRRVTIRQFDELDDRRSQLDGESTMMRALFGGHRRHVAEERGIHRIWRQITRADAHSNRQSDFRIASAVDTSSLPGAST